MKYIVEKIKLGLIYGQVYCRVYLQIFIFQNFSLILQFLLHDFTIIFCNCDNHSCIRKTWNVLSKICLIDIFEHFLSLSCHLSWGAEWFIRVTCVIMHSMPIFGIVETPRPLDPCVWLNDKNIKVYNICIVYIILYI